MIKEISIIVPFLNEKENINELCMTLDSYAKGKSYSFEIIFVDDGSTDESNNLIQKYTFHNVSAKLIKLSKNYGSHAAIRAGIQSASADYCMFFSADLQEPVEMVDRMVKKIEKGYDYVCARKKSSKSSFLERLFSYAYSLLIRKFAVKQFPFGGVNNILFNKKIKDNLNKKVERNSSIFLQVINMGYKMAIIDVSYRSRERGSSKWTLRKRIKLLIDSFVSFSSFPVRLVSVVGIIFFFCGIAVAIITVIIKVFNILPLALGWPTVISILSIGFGITNISLGIMAEYLWRDYDYARNNEPFLIDEVYEIKVK